MVTSQDRLGELRIKLLPHVIRHLSERGNYPDTAALSLAAVQSFDRAFTLAETFHLEHPEEDPDLHLANLMQVFHDEVGIPYLQTLSVIEEFILPP